MKNICQFSFHESTVLEFKQQNHIITIKLEDVMIKSNMCKVNIKCIEVNKIKIDEEEGESVFMETDCGEVLTLEISDKKILAIIQWDDFNLKKIKIKSYEISCEEIQIDIDEE